MVLDSAVLFAASLLVGAVGIYAGARVATGVDSLAGAAVTALAGAVVWALVDLFLGWIPLLGPAATVVAYVGVVKWRYPGGWLTAAAIALVAVVTASVVLWALGTLGVGGVDAFGVPGV